MNTQNQNNENEAFDASEQSGTGNGTGNNENQQEIAGLRANQQIDESGADLGSEDNGLLEDPETAASDEEQQDGDSELDLSNGQDGYGGGADQEQVQSGDLTSGDNESDVMDNNQQNSGPGADLSDNEKNYQSGDGTGANNQQTDHPGSHQQIDESGADLGNEEDADETADLQEPGNDDGTAATDRQVNGL